MRVVLAQDYENLGKKGDVVEVKDGYGMNFLVPKGIAMIATEEAIAIAQEKTKKRKERKEQMLGMVDSIAKTANKKTFEMKVKVSSGGRTYSAVGAEEVAGELGKQWNLDGSDVKIEIDLAQPIKELGKYPLDVTLSSADSKKKIEIVLQVVEEG